jgi:hypothetical protein
MQIEGLGIAVLLMGGLGWLLGTEFSIHVFLASTLLGAAAALVLTSLSFANVQPAHLLLCFVVCAALARRRSLATLGRSLSFPNEGFWLLLTALYAVLSAALLPRIFAGATYVYEIARTEIGTGIVAVPLAPASGNITQPIYFFGDVVCFLSFYIFASEPAGVAAVTRAVFVCAALNLLFAALDLATWGTGSADLLSVIRNANYRMLDDATTLGMKRIVGSFPEASTFAYFTLGWFAFCARLWLSDRHRRVAGLLALLSLVVLLLSTSSTGYGGLAGFGAALYVTAAGQALTRPLPIPMVGFLLLAPALAALLFVGLRLDPPVRDTMQNMLDTMIVGKLSTASGIEREKWNRQALTNFADTDGLGGGVGSVRASSFPVAVLGNIGAIGAVAYGSFLLALFFRRRGRWTEPYPSDCQSAARWACFTQLIAASVSGSFIDLGLPFFVFAGLASAGPVSQRISSPARAAETVAAGAA